MTRPAHPLQGHRIAVTRAHHQAAELIARIEAAGARTIALPTIQLEPPADPEPLDRALRHLHEFRGFIFTSANAVEAFFARARALGVAPLRPGSSWISAVGPATAATLAQAEGWAPSIVPADHHAEGVLAALAAVAVEHQAILFPRAAHGRDLIPVELARRGARVSLVEAYRTGLAVGSQAPARALFPAEGVPGADTVILTSASTVRNLAELLGPDYRARLRGAALAALGPSTRQAVEALGLAVAVQAESATAASVIEAIGAYWNARTP